MFFPIQIPDPGAWYLFWFCFALWIINRPTFSWCFLASLRSRPSSRQRPLSAGCTVGWCPVLFKMIHKLVTNYGALCCSRWWCSNWWQFIKKVALSVGHNDLLIPEEPSLVSRSPGHRPLWRWSPESVFQLINPSVGPKSKVFEWMNYWCLVVFHLSALEIVSSSDLLGQTTVFSLEATNLQGSSIVFVIIRKCWHHHPHHRHLIALSM